MTDSTLDNKQRNILYIPCYRVCEAAKYSGLSTQAASYWLRTSPERSKETYGVSYLELVEIAFVSTFRACGISLQKIRKAKDYAARMLKLECKYPFAQHKWFS